MDSIVEAAIIDEPTRSGIYKNRIVKFKFGFHNGFFINNDVIRHLDLLIILC